MGVSRYVDIDIKGITLSQPIKEQNYTSKILYKEQEIFLQTPVITKNGDTLEFSMVNNGKFFSFFEELNEFLIEYVYVHSKELFNGKEFSENRIRNSLHKIVEVNENVSIPIKTDPKIRIINIFNEPVSEVVENLTGKCIINIRDITFTKKEFFVNIYLTNMKLSPKKLSKKKDPVDLDSETEPEIVEPEIVEPEIVEPEIVEPEIVEPEISSLEIKENVDDLEFFE
jgi:hypothetical protein